MPNVERQKPGCLNILGIIREAYRGRGLKAPVVTDPTGLPQPSPYATIELGGTEASLEDVNVRRQIPLGWEQSQH